MIFSLLKQSNLSYPLMRDHQRMPRCYEFTDQEREEATRKVDELLKERFNENEYGYYGA